MSEENEVTELRKEESLEIQEVVDELKKISPEFEAATEETVEEFEEAIEELTEEPSNGLTEAEVIRKLNEESTDGHPYLTVSQFLATTVSIHTNVQNHIKNGLALLQLDEVKQDEKLLKNFQKKIADCKKLLYGGKL